MKRYLSIGVLGGVLVIAGAPTSASAATITVQDNFFSPARSTLDLGDGSFDWQWGPDGVGTRDIHNVVEDNGLFTSGTPVSSRPEGFSVTASAGKYPYFCQIHIGMEGEVAVRPVVVEPLGRRAARGVRVSWASNETTTGSTYDVRYRAKQKWKLWKKNTSKTSGVFGRAGKPVKLKRKPVKLQARSRSGKKRSEWSPKLKLTG